jgi:hypothetical protein
MLALLMMSLLNLSCSPEERFGNSRVEINASSGSHIHNELDWPIWARTLRVRERTKVHKDQQNEPRMRMGSAYGL